MLWFFEKNGERLQCEIRPCSFATGFELELSTADGQKQLERADNAETLAVKWLELDYQLKRDGWIKKA